MNRRLRLLCVVLATPLALGLVIDGANQQRYEEPPPSDPGWQNVGRRGSTSAIYLGGGWVLTARHSAMGEVVLGESAYQPVGDSMVWLDDPSGGKADLLLFRIQPEPELPTLRLIRRAPAPGSQLLLVGYGSSRGEAVAWSGFEGFRFGPGGTRRWGMNTVSPGHIDVTGPNETITRCFQIEFTRGGVHEAQAGVGDSGGAVFVRREQDWRLAGVMLSVSRLPGQKGDLALFGNVTNAADLSVYARQILEVTGESPATR